MDQPVHNHLSKFPKRSTLVVGLILVGLTLTGIGASVYFTFTQKTTDTRSRAALSNTTSFETIRSESDTELVVDVYANLGTLQNTQVRSFDLSLSVQATSSSVLGISTDQAAQQRDSASMQRNRQRINTPGLRRKFVIPPGDIKVCLDEVVTSGNQLVWKTTCKGDIARGNCTTSPTPLTQEELLRYDAWVDLKKPSAARCVFVPPTGHPASRPTVNSGTQPPAQETSTPGTPLPTVLPTATPTPVLLTSVEGLSVYKSGVDLFTYATPVITPRSNSAVITLTGKVENSTQQSKLNGRVLIAQIKIKKSSPAQRYSVVIDTQSLKGIRSVAPGVEVELLEKPTPKTTESTSSALPVEQ